MLKMSIKCKIKDLIRDSKDSMPTKSNLGLCKAKLDDCYKSPQKT